MIPKTLPKVRDFYNQHITYITQYDSLDHILDVLTQHHLSNCPVIDLEEGKKGNLVGMISESDCLRALSDQAFFAERYLPQACDLMAKDVIVVHPNDDIIKVEELMSTHGLRHLPVVSGEKLIGIVSRREVLLALQKMLQQMNLMKKAEIVAADPGKSGNLYLYMKYNK